MQYNHSTDQDHKWENDNVFGEGIMSGSRNTASAPIKLTAWAPDGKNRITQKAEFGDLIIYIINGCWGRSFRLIAAQVYMYRVHSNATEQALVQIMYLWILRQHVVSLCQVIPIFPFGKTKSKLGLDSFILKNPIINMDSLCEAFDSKLSKCHFSRAVVRCCCCCCCRCCCCCCYCLFCFLR